MDAKQLHILQHSLGLDQYGRGTMYRNHFVTGEGSVDYPHCMALVEAGHMNVRKQHPLSGGDDCFWVTDVGKKAVIDNSPPPPKLTRGQQTYQDWMNYDSDMPFIEYAKMKSHLQAREKADG